MTKSTTAPSVASDESSITRPLLGIFLCFCFLGAWAYLESKEITDDAYAQVYYLANHCNRDTCDSIVDALSNGKISYGEYMEMYFGVKDMGNTSYPDMNPKEAKSKLIAFVKEDKRFRAKERELKEAYGHGLILNHLLEKQPEEGVNK